MQASQRLSDMDHLKYHFMATAGRIKPMQQLLEEASEKQAQTVDKRVTDQMQALVQEQKAGEQETNRLLENVKEITEGSEEKKQLETLQKETANLHDIQVDLKKLADEKMAHLKQEEAVKTALAQELRDLSRVPISKQDFMQGVPSSNEAGALAISTIISTIFDAIRSRETVSQGQYDYARRN